MITFVEYIKENAAALNEERLPKLKLLSFRHPVVKTVEAAIRDKMKVISWMDKRAYNPGLGVHVEWQGDDLPKKSDLSTLSTAIVKALSPEYNVTSNTAYPRYLELEFASKKAEFTPNKLGIRFNFNMPDLSYNARWFASYSAGASKEFGEITGDIICDACEKIKIQYYNLYHPKCPRPPFSFGTKGTEINVALNSVSDAEKFEKSIIAGAKKAKFTVEDGSPLWNGGKEKVIVGKNEDDALNFYMVPFRNLLGWMAIYDAK